MLFTEPVTDQLGMSGGRRPPMEDRSLKQQPTDFRVPSATSNWLRTTYQVDNNASGGGTTTTTRHFAAWEQTTHFPRGHHTHPLLAASASLNSSSPLIRPIPNRLASPPRSPLLTSEAKPSLTSSPQGLNLIKLESRPHGDVDTDGNDSAFEDWETSCSRTTPNNHKSIRKWRQQSQPGGGRVFTKPSSTPSSMPAGMSPISIMTSSPIDHGGGRNSHDGLGGPLSAPSVMHSWPHQIKGQNGSSCYSPSDSLFTSPASTSSGTSDLKRRLKSETVTSPESISSVEDNKPIGIAVGRQRTPTTSAEAISDSGHETSGSSTDKSCSILEDSGLELKRPVHPPPRPSSHVTPGLQLPALSPLDVMMRQPQYWPLQYMHAAAAASPSQPPPMGTFPASTAVTTKDIYPMYLYNGFGPLAAAAAASMWPSSPAAAAASAFGATPFQQSLIQLQQESWLARHQQNAAAGFLFNQQQQQPQEESSPASSPPRRPTAPPPVIRSPSPVASCSPKENGDHDDNVSVGGLSDELEVQQQHSSKGQKTSGNGSCSSSDLIKVKVESLKAEDDTSGLQLLTEGIDRLEHISTSPSTSSTTSSSTSPLKPPPPQRPPVRKFTSSSQSLTSRSQGGPSPSKLGLLCDAAFLSDDEAHLRSETLSDSNNDNSGKARSRSLDSPQKKPRTLSSEYRSPKAERNAKAFIASKSLKVSEDLHHLELASNSHEAVGCSTTNMTGIGHGLNRSSSSSISSASNSGHSSSSISGAANGGEVSDRERNLRLNLADIQKKYKEKYKELQVINKKSFSSAAAGSASNGANGGSPNLAKMPAPKKMLDAKKTLAPITPWLHKLKNGTQRISNANNSATAAGENKKSSGNNNKNSADHHLQQRAAATVSASGPDLSTINSKFRSVRPNPFENLLKLSCVGKKSQEGIKKTEQEEIVSPEIDNANHETPPHATSTPKVKLHESSSNGADHRNSHQKQDLKPLPKLQLARPDVLLVEDHADADVSEVEDDLDNVQPPVLEPMLKPYNSKVAQMASSDSAEINNGNRATSDDAVEKPPPKITPLKIKRPLSSDTDNSSSRPKKSKKEKKSKKSKKERHRHREGADYHHKKHKPSVVHFNDDSETQAIDLVNVNDAGIIKSRLNKCSGVSSTKKKPIKEIFIEGPETCLIKENDLVDGLRVLVKLDGHFHPGKIQAISPPDIYGVLVDKERGNKPHIFCRDEVLQEAIFEVKPASVEALTIGTRVCAYWSQKYHHLYPGTISDMDIDPKLDSNYVNVELDDGDNRDIHVESIRYLPPAYPLVVCDPDPLMTIQSSRRKRRQSWESGTSDGSRPNKTPRASIDEPLQPPTTTVASTKTSKTSSSFSNVHSGDLKMRINVSQSKQKKSSSNSNSGDHHHRGQQNSSSSASLAVPSSVASSVAAKVVRKSTNNATLAQRPSISSSSDDEGKCGIASFLPKDQVWKWADKGQKRAKGRTYHKVIQRKKEKLSTGDSAVFLSTNCPDQPYIGRLEYMWETASGAKNVAVRWYYHLAEVDCVQDSDRKNLKKLKQPKGALFESNHYDENDVQTISHRCDVLSLDKFKIGSANQKQGLAAAAADPEEDSNDKYYLAGSHNAVEKTVQFSPGVLL